MRRKSSLILLILITVSLSVISQDTLIKDNLSGINRYINPDYKSLRDYIAMNSKFTLDIDKVHTGVLLTGIIIDQHGDIQRIFTLNSLDPKLDNYILNLLEATDGTWIPLSDSLNAKTTEIIIVPIVHYLKNTEYNIDKANFKLPIEKEILVTALALDGSQFSETNYQKTQTLFKEYEKLRSKGKYEKAYPIIIQLLKREPLSTKYYSELIRLDILLGNDESACQNLKFVKAYFVNQPDLDIIKNLDCR